MYAFDMNNPFWRFIGKLVDLVWLNILTMIFSLPVITAGASCSAMYKVNAIQLADNGGNPESNDTLALLR